MPRRLDPVMRSLTVVRNLFAPKFPNSGHSKSLVLGIRQNKPCRSNPILPKAVAPNESTALTKDIQQSLAGADANLHRKCHHHNFSQRQEFGLLRNGPMPACCLRARWIARRGDASAPQMTGEIP